jgi:hypothetical protein
MIWLSDNCMSSIIESRKKLLEITTPKVPHGRKIQMN